MTVTITDLPAGTYVGEEIRLPNLGAEGCIYEPGGNIRLVGPVILAPGDVLWLCWTGSEWAQDASASGPYSQSGYGPYDPDNGFPTAPRDRFKVIYLASGGLAQPTAPRVQEQGSDIMGDGSQLHPLYSLWGAFTKHGRLMEEGYHLLIKPGGGLTDDERAAGVNRWYGQCSSLRQYPLRGADIKGSEAYVGSWSVEGPLLGALLPTNLVVTNVQPIGEGTIANNGRSRWRYNANSGPLPQIGSWMRVRRAGRLVSFEMQVTKVVEDSPGSANGYIYTDGDNFTNGAVFDMATDVADFITHAAEFIPTSREDGVDLGEGGADGIGLTGFSCANMHGRIVNGANQRATWTMVGFENLNIRKFVGSFDRCFIYHQFNVFDSSLTLRGCVVNCQTPTKYVNSQINVQGQASPEAEQRGHFPEVITKYDEYCGDLSAADALLLKPINLSVGGISVLHTYVNEAVAGGAIVQGGRFEPRQGMTFVGGLVVQGGARFVMQEPEHPVFFRGVHDSGDAAAIWVKGDSVAIIGARNLTIDDADNHLRVGPYDTDPVDLGTEGAPEPGTFRDPTAWNFNLCRYAVTGGFPTGDFSAIRDRSLFPP